MGTNIEKNTQNKQDSKKYDSAFKAYDIRGIYQQDIDKNLCYNLGKGIAKYMLENFWKQGKLIFWGDVRRANDELISYFLNGLEEWWFNNYFCPWMPIKDIHQKAYSFWIISTSLLYHIAYQNFDLGLCFTASHNPAEYVGIKIFDTNASLLAPQKLKKMITSREEKTLSQKQIDKVRHWSFQEDNNLRELVYPKLTKKENDLQNKYKNINKHFKIVVDFSSWAGSAYEKNILEKLSIFNKNLELIFINAVPDSDFSAHESNTSTASNYEQLSQEVKKNNADLGVMFDGDVDRIWFVDNTWKYHSSDIVLTLIITGILKENSSFVADVMCSKALDDLARKNKSKCIRSRVGYRFVKQKMLDNQACLGGELSGHILFPETWSFENPLLALYYVLETIQKKGKIFNEILSELHPYHKPWIENFEVENPDTILEKIEKMYNNDSNYKIDKTDGIKIIADQRWFIVRKSNTEPIIRISMEANTKNIWEDQMKTLKEQLNLN